jgi:Polymer-forming cytoskeletal
VTGTPRSPGAVLVAMAIGLSAGAAALAGPASAAGPAASKPGDQIVLSGDVVVSRGRVSGDVVVVHGSARVDGTVRGSLVVLDGPVRVSGTVRGDVAALDGPVTLVRGAHVTGDVWVARGRLVVEVGAVIDGSVRRGAVSFLSPGRLVTKLGFWVAISVSTLLLGLLLLLLGPRAADAVAVNGRSAVGASIGWGAGLVIGLPVAAVVLLVTLVGIPFGLGLLLALGLLYSIGYAYAAWILGRVLVRPPRHGGPRRVPAFLAGWAILRAIGFVPVAGGVVWILAAGYGLGAATVAVWRARRGPRPVPPVSTPQVRVASGFGPTPPPETSP